MVARVSTEWNADKAFAGLTNALCVIQIVFVHEREGGVVLGVEVQPQGPAVRSHDLYAQVCRQVQSGAEFGIHIHADAVCGVEVNRDTARDVDLDRRLKLKAKLQFVE